MITGIRIGAALLGVAAMFASVEFSTGAMLQTASAQRCGCGKPSCGGCLAGLRNRRAGEEVAFSADDPIVSTVYGPEVEVAAAGCQSCQTCQTCEAPQPKPQCDCQYCELKTKKVEVDKTCFKVEQKEVCVPAVRLPWKKCCPPKKSRVRTVNVLKTDKYKDETCEYKWSVHEPEEYKEPEAAEPVAVYEPEQSATEGVISYPDPAAETTRVLELSDPAAALEDVPRPPLEK
jgi:hypothetical protein